MRRNESTENYLESILMLKEKNGSVRGVDIAHFLGFSKPSVSVAMKSFREQNYVKVDSNGDITLTPDGEKIASRIYERHNVIAKALVSLGVSEKTAYHDSCLIEHDLSDESFEKIKDHLRKANVI